MASVCTGVICWNNFTGFKAPQMMKIFLSVASATSTKQFRRETFQPTAIKLRGDKRFGFEILR
jgi:hypothetical protein